MLFRAVPSGMREEEKGKEKVDGVKEQERKISVINRIRNKGIK